LIAPVSLGLTIDVEIGTPRNSDVRYQVRTFLIVLAESVFFDFGSSFTPTYVLPVLILRQRELEVLDHRIGPARRRPRSEKNASVHDRRNRQLGRPVWTRKPRVQSRHHTNYGNLAAQTAHASCVQRRILRGSRALRPPARNTVRWAIDAIGH
jgi:hypothetical protein